MEIEITLDDIPDEEVREWYLKKRQPITDQPVPVLENIQIELTKNCNNACIMCHKGQERAGKINDDDIKNEVLNQISPAYPYLKHAALFGDGEPMLYKNFWDVIKDIHAASPECYIDFICNGSLLTANNVQNCLDYQVSHIGISMGGATRSTHERIRRGSSFEKVTSNLRYLRDEKKKISIIKPHITGFIVVMLTNYSEIPSFVRLCHELGFDRVACQQLFVTHTSMKQEVVSSHDVEPYFREAAEVAKEIGISFHHYPLESKQNYHTNVDSVICEHKADRVRHEKGNSAWNKWMPEMSGYCKNAEPWNTAYVLFDGKVVPCCHWWTSIQSPNLNVCGILKAGNSLADIWNGEIYREIRRTIQKGNILPQCRGCGLAGGIKAEYRCSETDHTNPDQEKEATSLQLESSSQRLKKIAMNSWYVQWLSKQWNTCKTKENIAADHVSRILQYNPSFDYQAYLNNMKLAFDEEIAKNSFLYGSPLVVDCELSDLCDYQCITCQPAWRNQRGHVMDEDIVDEIFEKLIPKAEIVDYAKLGEPFVLKQRMINVIRKARYLNPCIHQRVYSHGQRIDREVARVLVEYKFENLTISIDGSTSSKFKKFTQKGDLSKVIENLQVLQKIKKEHCQEFPRLTIATQLTSYANPLEIMQIAKEVGAVFVTFTGVIVFPDNEEKHQISKIVGPEAFGGSEALNEIMKKCRMFADEHGIGFGYPRISDFPYHGKAFPYSIANVVGGRHDPTQTCPTREPWYRWCMSGTGHISPCCHHPPLIALESSSPSNVPKVKIDEVWNHPRMQSMRKLLASGKRTKGCQCDNKMNYEKETINYTEAHNALSECDQVQSESIVKPLISHDQAIAHYAPLSIEIDPITYCNLNCVMCHNAKGNFFEAWKVDLDTIRYISDCTKKSPFYTTVSLAGAGEFFLHTDWRDILRILNEGKCNVEILTNALVLDHEHIDYIWSKTSVKMLQISVDAANGLSYYNIRGSTQFSEIKKTLQYMCSHPDRKMVRLSFVVMNENMKQINDFVHLAKEVGADGVLYQHMHDRKLQTTKRDNGFVFDEFQRPSKDERKNLIIKTSALAQQKNIFIQLNQMPEIPLNDSSYQKIRRKYYRGYRDDVIKHLPFKAPCWLPWVMLNRTFEGKWRVCCMSSMQSNLGGKNASLEEAWNSIELQKIRRNILAGKCPKECLPEFCHVARDVLKCL